MGISSGLLGFFAGGRGDMRVGGWGRWVIDGDFWDCLWIRVRRVGCGLWGRRSGICGLNLHENVEKLVRELARGWRGRSLKSNLIEKWTNLHHNSLFAYADGGSLNYAGGLSNFHAKYCRN